MVTEQRLKQLFNYNPNTGLFTWLVRISGCCNIGDVAGYKNNAGRIVITIDKKREFAHRMAWLYHYGSYPNGVIDHINHDPTDNRIENLRDVSHKQNMRNRSLAANNKSGFTGVCFDKKNKKWKSQIFIDKKCILIGFFDSIEEAATKRREAEKLYFGEFAPSHHSPP